MAQRKSTDPPLAEYNARRDFKATSEPRGRAARPRRTAKGELSFVVQKHWASHLHYDFRLELDGVMLSWAVPKGPSLDPTVKRMAVQVEDHPVSYNQFEGEIPAGHYGAGRVIIWDRGHWTPLEDAREGIERGKLGFELHGEKLTGAWELVRTRRPQGKRDAWLLIKKRDAHARASADYDVITAQPDSVVTHPGHPPVVDLGEAVRARLPQKLDLQLATLTERAPSGGDWVVEHKLDGYRMGVRVSRGKAALFSRNGHDWTDRLAPLARAIEKLGIDEAWLDGEIVVMDEHGVPDFNRLQNAIDSARARDIQLFLFDLPFLQGQDLRRVPLRNRRARLQALLAGQDQGPVRFSEALPGTPDELLAAACRIGLEGVMLKRADAPYVGRRTDTWLKLKCRHRQEFVVVGFTDRANAPGEVGALVLGYHDEQDGGRLRTAGLVGTGWSAMQGRVLHRQLARLQTKRPAVDAQEVKAGRRSGASRGQERWVRPEMVVEVAFAGWTPEGRIRHAAFQGVRSDKPAKAVSREKAVSPPKLPAAPAPTAAAARRGGVTHPERVIDAESGLRKIDLVHYFESVAEYLLRHLRERPVSLVRAPRGVGGQLFFQKHAEDGSTGLRELDASLWPGHAPLLVADNVEHLLAAAQMNVVEFHTWNATTRDMTHPDRVVFDLDPGEGVPWAHVREAAALTRAALQELGLRSWLKTSGGKGLHVVVPLAPQLDDAEVKRFARAVAVHMARTLPQRFVAKSGPANRVGRIFIDYLRNGQGQTTVAAFSPRARPGLGVSMPVDWEQLDEIKSGAHWTVRTAREHLSLRGADPWAGFWRSRQRIKRWPPEGD